MAKIKAWSLEEDDVLRNLIAGGRYAFDVAVRMGHSESAVRARAKQLDMRFAAAPRGCSLKRLTS